METAHREVERLLDQIRAISQSPAIERATDQISVLCSAFMEPDASPSWLGSGLTPNAGRMLELLLKRRGSVVTREALLNACWHQADSAPSTKNVDVYVHHIRKRFPAYQIEPIRGTGYRMLHEGQMVTTDRRFMASTAIKAA